MSTNNLPGMLANAVQGFNRTWTAVQSHSNRKGDVTAWSFTCGCGASKYYKTNRHGENAHALALRNVEDHRCPPKRKTMLDGIKAIAKAA